MISRISLNQKHYQMILEHVLSGLPEETCGLLGGKISGEEAIICDVIAVENEIHSAVRFKMAPEEQIRAILSIEARGLELTAIYHAHPNGPGCLSKTDLDEFLYPGVVMVLCFPEPKGSSDKPPWALRAFEVHPDAWGKNISTEIPLDILSSTSSNEKDG